MLQLELIEAGKTHSLKPQPYRSDRSLDLDGKGMYPVELAYRDLVKLDQLRSAADQPLALKPGDVVRYWLEATDNCDYPNKTGNVGKSPAYEIKILPPEDEAKQKREREQAQDRQTKHNKQQDDKLAQDKKQKEQQADKAKSPDAKKADDLKKDLQNDLDKFNQPGSPPDKGGAKGQEPNRADNKPGGGDGGGQEPPAKEKDQKPSDPNQAGSSKSGPQAGGADNSPSTSKDAGPPNEQKSGNPGGNDSQPSAGQPQNDPNKGTSKDAPSDPGGQGRGDDDGSTEKPSQTKPAGPDTPPKTSQSQAKGDDTGKTAPSAQSKPGGGTADAPPPTDQRPQGFAKPEEATGPRSLSKEKGPETGSKSADPKLKNEKGDGEVVGAGTDNKPPPKDAAKEGVGLSKGDEKPAEQAEQRTPTPQDVEHLKNLMQRKDGIADLAAKALEQMAKDAPDPKVREQAKKALDEASRKTEPGDDSPNPRDPKSAGGKPPAEGDKGAPDKGNPKLGKPDPAQETKAGKGSDPSGQASGTTKSGSPGQKPQPGASPGDDGKGDPARKDLSRFGGNLQLEDFIKRATPEYRAKNGITPEEWDRLLARAAEYDALLRKMQKQARNRTPSDARGTAGALSGVSPTQVQRAPNATDPTDGRRAEPPAELRDPVRRFQESPRGPMP
jgi:hypothetical protein